jgi:hypothetical protein
VSAEQVEVRSTHRAHANVERVLWVSVFAAAGIGVLGWWNPQGWKLLEVAVGYPALWIAAAFVLVPIAAFVGCRSTRIQVIAVVISSLVGVAAVALTAFGIWWSGWERAEVVASPDDPSLRVVIDEGSDVIDPLWRISVEHGAGLTARRWDVTCINGDWAGYPGIEWTQSGGSPAFRIRSPGGGPCRPGCPQSRVR